VSIRKLKFKTSRGSQVDVKASGNFDSTSSQDLCRNSTEKMQENKEMIGVGLLS